jgi:hypothetical protein
MSNKDQYNIATMLDIDPEVNYFLWKINLEDVAANAAILIEATGLLSRVMNDEEWDNYPANAITNATTGAITIAARPTSPAHKPIVAGMTGPNIAICKYANDRHETWHNAKEQMKMAIITSLGATLAATIGPPPHGFKMMNINE